MAVQITGNPGTGKTYSLKTLDPNSTFIIDADKKGGLAWAKWRDSYSEEKKNYFKTSDIDKIKVIMKKISDNQPNINVIVVDTINTIASDIQMYDLKKASHDARRAKIPLIARIALEFYIPQSNYEIWIHLMV